MQTHKQKIIKNNLKYQEKYYEKIMENIKYRRKRLHQQN